MRRCLSAALSVLAVCVLHAGPPPDRVWEGGAASSLPATSSLKVVSWNIERGLQLESVKAVLREHSPALALLQEVDRDARRTGRRNIPEELARDLGLAYLFAAEFEELGQGSRDAPAYHGQAILTALPVSSTRIIRFTRQTGYWQPRWFLPNWAVFQRRTGGRLTLAAEVQTAQQRLVIYNVHLESRGPEDLRLSQIEEVLADSRRYPDGTPILIAGDLNTRKPSSSAIAALLKAGFRKAVGDEVTTIRGAALDWIFVRGPVSFEEGAIHRDVRASDHFPLSVRIRLDDND